MVAAGNKPPYGVRFLPEKSKGVDSLAAIRDRYAEKGGVLSFRPKRPDRFRSRPTSVPRAPEDELRGALILAGRRIAQIIYKKPLSGLRSYAYLLFSR